MLIRPSEQEVDNFWPFWRATGEEVNSTEIQEPATLVRFTFQPCGLGHSKTSPPRQREGYCILHFILLRRQHKVGLGLLETIHTYLGMLLLANLESY